MSRVAAFWFIVLDINTLHVRFGLCVLFLVGYLQPPELVSLPWHKSTILHFLGYTTTHN